MRAGLLARANGIYKLCQTELFTFFIQSILITLSWASRRAAIGKPFVPETARDPAINSLFVNRY